MKLNDIDNMYVGQKAINDCWYASYLMVVSYITGQKVDYNAEKTTLSGLIAEYRAFVADPTYDPFQNGMGSDFICKCLNELHQQSYANYYTDVAPQSTMIQRIEDSLKNNRPVIIGLNIGQNFGHFVVLVGIDGTALTGYTVQYFDPDPQKGDLLIQQNLIGKTLNNQPIGDYIVML